MKITRYLSLLIVICLMLPVLSVSGVAFAQEGEASATENITLSTEFPRVEAIATGTFAFNVELIFKGQVERTFDLSATVPQGWDVYITPQYETGKRISSIVLEPVFGNTGKTMVITITPPAYALPDPGDYKIVFEAVSDDVKDSIELTAKVTAKYTLNAAPTNQLYNMNALAGKDNIFSIQVANLGTAPIDNITFSSTKPEGWEIKFTPEKIDVLEVFDPKNIDVNIKPPPRTVAGDYMITLNITGKQTSADKIDVRVRVETPSIWGWVGVGIIAVVVIGLIVIFMRFGRR